MKVLLVSDTHGRNEGLWAVREREMPVDVVIHMGDIEGAVEELQALFDCSCYVVRGNNDRFSSLKRELEFSLGAYRVFVVHGDQYQVGAGVEGLCAEAHRRGAEIVMFGHTHIPYLEEREGLLVLNPGSLTYSREVRRRRSYMVMELNGNEKPQVQVHYL